jgi:HPt (histidine-containing phosphotransfer) domain-containing protein
MSEIPPNEDLAELVALLGMDNVRLLLRTFLREYPLLIEQLESGDRKTRHRIAHSLKSNARVIGARTLSSYMAAIEERLSHETGSDLSTSDIASIRSQFDSAGREIRVFIGE